MLDLRTLVLATFVSVAGFAVAMHLLRRALPEDEGLHHWSRGALALCVGIFLQGMRGTWAPWLAIAGGNALITMGMLWFAFGAAHMAGRKLMAGWVFIGGAVTYSLMLLLGEFPNALYMRLQLQSAVLVAITGWSAHLFWHFPNERQRRICRATAVVYGMAATMFLLRMVLAEPENLSNPALAEHSWELIVPYAFAMLFLTWLSIVVSVLAADQLMSRLRVALAKAEESDRMKSAFLASITHEWRTPLNAISGFSQLLRRDGHAPEEVRQSAELIHNAGVQLLDVVNDLLDLRLLQEGTMEFQFSLAHIQPLVDQAVAANGDLARQCGVRVLTTGTATNPTLWVDSQRLRQVLGNLVSNAIRFNRPGGQVEVSWEIEGHSAQVRVMDNGPGIPYDLQHRLFKPFDRLGAESGPVPGTGIGLAITQQLVQRMGGTVGFSSHPDVGSEFWVRFPLAERVHGEVVLQTPVIGSSGEDASTQPNLPQEPAIPQSKRVLYIEDNPTNQKLVRAVFQKQMGIAVDTAFTAEEGLVTARTQPPGLILLDINLPGMDGYQALKALRADERTAHIPVMALTAQVRPEDRLRGEEAGFDAYLTKPLNLGNLVATAMQLLRRR